MAVGPRHDYGPEMRACLDERGEPPIQLFGNDQQLCPAVIEHEPVVILVEQRIHRNGDDAGLDGAKERGRPIDGVGEAQQNAVFGRDAEVAEHMAEA